MSTGPGPGPLGRSVVVESGQPVPPGWADAPVVVIDEAVVADPAAAVAELHAAWAERRPVVVELAVDPARFREPVSIPGSPWMLGSTSTARSTGSTSWCGRRRGTPARASRSGGGGPRPPAWPRAHRPRPRARPTWCWPTARRRGSTAGPASPSTRRSWGATASCTPTRSSSAGWPSPRRRSSPPPTWPPTSWPPSPTSRARPASSPPPDRARPASSPSGCATCIADRG